MVKDPPARRTWAVRIGVAISILIALLSIFWLALSSLPPSGWMTLNAGEARPHIISEIGEPDVDMRDMKGYDAWNSETTRFLAAKGYWQMLLTYDSSSLLSTRTAYFVPFESGGYNDWIPDPVLEQIKRAYYSRTP